MSKKIMIGESQVASHVFKEDLFKKNMACVPTGEKKALIPFKEPLEMLKEEERMLKNIDEYRNYISERIETCQYETEIDEKIDLFFHINSLLPASQRLRVLSLLTDDYIDTMLYNIQIKIESLCNDRHFDNCLQLK